MTTFRIDDFSGGRDKRPRLFYGKNKNLWRNLTDAFTGKDRKPHRRWPLRFAAGTLTALGAASVEGALTYFASKTFGGVASVSGINIGVLYFDELPNHVATQLVDAKLFNGSVVALIRHNCQFNFNVTYMLHVFDGAVNKPTYVEDPFFPVSWGPTLPLHVYRTGTLGAYIDFVPQLGIAAGKVYVSRPDGNLAFSAPNNARVWNTRTPTQLATEGEWFYWQNYDPPPLGLYNMSTGVDGVATWVISESFDDLSLEAKWSCYVLEYCDDDGTWQKMVEDTDTPTAHGHYRPIARTSRYGGPDEISFQVYSTSALGSIFRFRLITGQPPIVVTDGCTYSTAQDRSAGHLTFEGVVYEVPVLAGAPVAGDRAMFLCVAVPGINVQERPYTVSASIPTAFGDLTGYQRYHALILGWDFVGSSGGATDASLTDYVIDSASVAGVVQGHGYQAGNESEFYIDRTGKQLTLAGFGLAGFLPTASHVKSDGGQITALSVIKGYLGIHYPSVTLLWAVNVNQLLDVHKDTISFGTGLGDQLTAEFYNQSIVYTQRGFRAFSVGGYQSDRADDTNIGEANEAFAETDPVYAMRFWPYTGQFVALMNISGTLTLFVFDYSKDSKISSWSAWTLPLDSTQISTCLLVPVGSRLYIGYKDHGLCYFDAQPGTNEWFDDVSPGGVIAPYAYRSIAEAYHNDMNAPGFTKKFHTIDVTAEGETRVDFVLLSGGLERTIPGTVIDGTTIGSKRVRLAMRAPAVAVKFSSTDPSGWTLDSYALEYDLCKR